jgi:osmotically inducible lipoprotein OsmB
MKTLISVAVIMTGLALSSCTTSDRRDAGLVGGGVLGGVAGSALTGGSLLGTVAGAAGGAYVGREVSK